MHLNLFFIMMNGPVASFPGHLRGGERDTVCTCLIPLRLRILGIGYYHMLSTTQIHVRVHVLYHGLDTCSLNHIEILQARKQVSQF